MKRQKGTNIPVTFLFRKSGFLAALVMLAGLGWASQAHTRTEGPSWRFQGGEGHYLTRSRDSLYSIAGRLGQRWEYLARLNGLQPPFALSVGQRLQINTRHLVPAYRIRDGLLLNLPGHMLYLFQSGVPVKKFPVAIGRPNWPTPEGTFTILGKRKNPIWTVPKSIQEELRQEGKAVLEKVYPGPDNPLGQYWLPLSAPGYGIHSTIWPESIGHSTSHGCIRMLPEDIEALFPHVRSGTPVTIIYDPVKLTAGDDGKVYLEAHPNVYQKPGSYGERLRRLADQTGLTERLDWSKAGIVLSEQAGVAEDISRATGGISEQALK